MTVWQQIKRVELADNAILISFRTIFPAPALLKRHAPLYSLDLLHPEYAALLGAITPPVQFQAIPILSATQSGSRFLTITAAIARFAIISGILIALNGKYRPFISSATSTSLPTWACSPSTIIHPCGTKADPKPPSQRYRNRYGHMSVYGQLGLDFGSCYPDVNVQCAGLASVGTCE
ncbi:hypothetical protein BDV38DRAFT_276715 [Aspergillus pseudotamarii]|uniref:Uncharacterized protein n=1 Tax=Aspergillus pseudotamarii TaxID=132259 RepID=A0A5N6TBY1_ASPPS|nr:uncharacterized protein BDV38DRAFT_276715 [Aspergillus pseudotamarii]KAE8143631.1 hypothetical protein BDV38DRAFT_276715 [Aspergillus pseudotamarii]